MFVYSPLSSIRSRTFHSSIADPINYTSNNNCPAQTNERFFFLPMPGLMFVISISTICSGNAWQRFVIPVYEMLNKCFENIPPEMCNKLDMNPLALVTLLAINQCNQIFHLFTGFDKQLLHRSRAPFVRRTESRRSSRLQMIIKYGLHAFVCE